MRISGLIVALLVLTGCQSLTRNNDNTNEAEKVSPVAKVERGFCLFDEPPQTFEHNCDATYWLNKWIDAANQPWLKRKHTLKSLSDSKSMPPPVTNWSPARIPALAEFPWGSIWVTNSRLLRTCTSMPKPSVAAAFDRTESGFGRLAES